MENTILEKLSNIIKERYSYIKERDDLLAISRRSGTYFHVFRDSLYEYAPGVFLIDRFYKKEFAKSFKGKVSIFSENDKDTINEFHNFSKEIENLSEEEFKEKSKELLTKVDNIKPQKIDVDMFSFDYSSISKLDLKELAYLTKDEINFRSFSSAQLIETMYVNLFYVDTFDKGCTVTTIDGDEYVDIIFIPVKPK